MNETVFNFNDSFREMPQYVTGILSVLENAGFSAYVVGGAVRDMVLGVVPHDYDVATSATPDAVVDLLEKNGIAYTDMAAKHGTVMALTGSGPVEITTFRIDGGYSDGRRPDEVGFTRDINEDVMRRDSGGIFTQRVVFGGVNSVHLDGDIAVLGDPFADVGGVDSAGAAWIFARNAGGSNAWGQVAVVRSDAPAALARFGYSVAVDGQALLVGAPTDDPGGLVDTGRATVFTGFLYGPPRISSFTQTGNVFSVTFPSQPAWNYELEGSLNLTGGAWLGIPGLSGLPGETDGTTTITHTNVLGGTAYRIQRSEP